MAALTDFCAFLKLFRSVKSCIFLVYVDLPPVLMAMSSASNSIKGVAVPGWRGFVACCYEGAFVDCFWLCMVCKERVESWCRCCVCDELDLFPLLIISTKEI